MGNKPSLLSIINVIIYLYIVAPVIIVIVIAFSGTESVAFPPTSFSLRWFHKFVTEEELMRALGVSLVLAVGASVISLLLGGLAAFGIARGDFGGRTLILNLLMTPLMVPVLVIALAFLEYFAALGLTAFPSLLLAHTAVTLPYVVRTMVAGLSGMDMLAEQAAVSLGATRLQAIRQITLPMLANSMLAGVLFSFIISFEDLPLALFLADPFTITLPMQIYSYIYWNFDPTIPAASTIQVIVIVFLVFCAERFMGLSRFMAMMK